MANVVDYVFYSGSVGTSEDSQSVRVKNVKWIKNTHVSQSLTIGIDNDTDSNAIVLAAGEELKDLGISAGIIYFKGSDASTTFKFLGTERY